MSKTTQYRRLAQARALACSVDDLPDRRGRHGNHVNGSDHYRWNKGRLMTSDGYALVRVGVGHPLADPNGYCREHDLIMAAAIGRSLTPDEIVHHVNGDKTDNRIENLQLTHLPEHNAHHNADRGRDEMGRFLPVAGRLLDGCEYSEFPEVPEHA